MNCYLSKLAFAPVLCGLLGGCTILETTGEVVGELATITGEVVLGVADLATFGSVSYLTGQEDAEWAASADSSAAIYGMAAGSALSAASSSGSSSGGPRGSTYGNASIRPTPSSASAASGKASMPRSGYSGSELKHCITLINDDNRLASFIQNDCQEKLTVSFVPTSGLGAGGRGTLFVSANSRQSTNKTSSISGLVVCRYTDFIDAAAGHCNVAGR